jgi:hypothetical protein
VTTAQLQQTERDCRCGCGQSLAHRRYGAVWASESCRKAFLRERAPANASRKRPPRPSGIQVSYRKAVEAIVARFGPHMYGHWCYPQSFEDEIRQNAELALLAALSPRARAQVELQRQEAK